MNKPLKIKILFCCMAICPLFIFTVKGWMNGILFLSSLISLYLLIKLPTIKKPKNTKRNNSSTQKWLRLFIFTLAAPICAIFISQLFRQDFSWSYYDAPSRLLICIPILYVMIASRLNVVNSLGYAIPFTILINLFSILIHPNYTWGPDRVTTFLADPLTFGSINLTLGLLSLLSISALKDHWLTKLLKIVGFVAGVYLAIHSGSRTGWFAMPVILMLWLQPQTLKTKLSSVVISLILVSIIALALFNLSTTVHIRSGELFSEALNYRWDTLNPDTSTAMRISFFRIACFLFAQNPLAGWGDTGFGNLLNDPYISAFASSYTRQFPLHAGFHNEITTNMVRSGIWGLISSVVIFLIPTCFFAAYIRSKNQDIRKIALLGISFMICAFFSGMSTEIFNLKYTAAFYGMMITILAGSLFVCLQANNQQ